jgi:hypothetical protein
MILTFVDDLIDHRRAQGQRYDLKYVLLFSIMALLSNSKSYRDISRYIKQHFEIFKKDFSLKWKRAPAYTTVRNIIRGINGKELEACFRAYSQSLLEPVKEGQLVSIAGDGKTLRGSFDNFEDKKAIQILSFFETNQKLILAHECIEEKTNEIPVVQKLLQELGLTDYLYTLDALHCQKKPLKMPSSQKRNY